ncbi:MAG: GtrA family protein [Bacteroidetes bacterium]|nr:MAG: GtrA family protein [Bacteroidota bacterium]
MWDFLFTFLKFGIVGLSGVFVDFTITYLLKEKLKINWKISNVCGFVCAATTNYFLNRIWTFESTNPEISLEYLKFFLVSLVGLGLNMTIIWFLHNYIKLPFYFSKVTATVFVMAWNFILNFLITFAKV